MGGGGRAVLPVPFDSDGSATYPVFGVIAKNFSFYVKKLHFFVLRLQSNSIKQKIRVFFFYIFFGIKLSVKLCNIVTSKLKELYLLTF